MRHYDYRRGFSPRENLTASAVDAQGVGTLCRLKAAKLPPRVKAISALAEVAQTFDARYNFAHAAVRSPAEA